MTELHVHFPGAASALEQEAHLQHAGFFLPAIDPMPKANAALELSISSATGVSLQLRGTVVQSFPGTGFAVAPENPDEARAALQPLFEAAHADGAEPGGPIEVSWSSGEEEQEGTGGTTYDRIRAMNTREKMQLARHGGRAERAVLMKDKNKTLHTFVIQNRGLTLDEVRYYAGYRQANPETLKMIAENRTWLQNPSIAAALVRNPKTPSSIAVRLLDRLPKAEVARLAKGGVSRPVQEAARRKVLTGR